MLCKQIQFFLGIIFSIKRFFKKQKLKKKPKSRRGNRLVLPHASYGPDNTSHKNILFVTSRSSGEEFIPHCRSC